MSIKFIHWRNNPILMGHFDPYKSYGQGVLVVPGGAYHRMVPWDHPSGGPCYECVVPFEGMYANCHDLGWVRTPDGERVYLYGVRFWCEKNNPIAWGKSPNDIHLPVYANEE